MKVKLEPCCMKLNSFLISVFFIGFVKVWWLHEQFGCNVMIFCW